MAPKVRGVGVSKETFVVIYQLWSDQTTQKQIHRTNVVWSEKLSNWFRVESVPWWQNVGWWNKQRFENTPARVIHTNHLSLKTIQSLKTHGFAYKSKSHVFFTAHVFMFWFVLNFHSIFIILQFQIINNSLNFTIFFSEKLLITLY